IRVQYSCRIRLQLLHQPAELRICLEVLILVRPEAIERVQHRRAIALPDVRRLAGAGDHVAPYAEPQLFQQSAYTWNQPQRAHRAGVPEVHRKWDSRQDRAKRRVNEMEPGPPKQPLIVLRIAIEDEFTVRGDEPEEG